MKRIFIIMWLLGLCSFVAVGQNTKANAKRLFEAGRYVEAKPVLEALLKRTPRAGELNYWYAVCCNETNDARGNVEERLKRAINQKYYAAYDYLGDYYKGLFRYADAIDCYENFVEKSKDDAAAARTKSKMEHVKELFRMLKTTENVLVVDSFIVDKNNFLSAYKCGVDAGTIMTMNEYSEAYGRHEGTLSITERGTDMYFARPVALSDTVSHLKIFHNTKNAGEWGSPKRLKGFDTGGSDNYPFMSADGSTFYFASSGAGSIGGYDIFVTRYDAEEDRFLLPTNVGMPFNSEANDYMMVVNEIANLGWFATDRRMPEGKVCVYVFVPNATKKVYNFETEDYSKMVSLSQLASVAETQTDDEALRRARRQLTMLLYEHQTVKHGGDFLFVIDDMTDYTRLSDFKCREARELFTQWQRRKQQRDKAATELDDKRTQYASGSNGVKMRMRNELLTLERRLEIEDENLHAMELRIRKLEIGYLNR